MKDRAMIFLFTVDTFNRRLPLYDEEGSIFIAGKSINEAKATLHHGLDERSV
jgi:hypothetical protein